MRRQSVRLKRASRQFGQDINTWRRIQNLTVEDVARRSGLSKSTVMRLEKGDPGVSLGAILAITQAFGQLELMESSMDPMKTSLGQLRLRDRLPHRVRR